MYKIELGNGNVIQPCECNGGPFYTKQAITKATFEYGLHKVKITPLLLNGTTESADDPDSPDIMIAGEYENMKLLTCCPCRYKPGYYMFCLGEKTAEEVKAEKTEARIEYLEMMTDE